MNVVLCFVQVTEDEKPPMDLFKSIFTESSASELSEEEDSEEENNKTLKNSTTTTGHKETNTNDVAVEKEESIIQHKQLNNKSQHLITEPIASLRDTQPKLTWIGVHHTNTKTSEQTTTPHVVSKPHNTLPVVSAPLTATTVITSSQYGPSIPPIINGNVYSFYCSSCRPQ